MGSARSATYKWKLEGESDASWEKRVEAEDKERGRREGATKELVGITNRIKRVERVEKRMQEVEVKRRRLEMMGRFRGDASQVEVPQHHA